MASTEKGPDRFLKARDRGGEFLLKQQRPDGSFGLPERGLGDYYKAISAYQCIGATREANRLCNWIRRHGLTPEGDFGPRAPESPDYCYAYYNSWVIIGAHRLGQFDISERGMDFLATFWDPQSGGFYSSSRERAATTKQDIYVVSGSGRAALYTGRMEIALGVGRWLRQVMEAQPDYPSKFYSVFSRAEGLHVNPSPSDLVRYVLDRDTTRDQWFFNPGISGGFLACLFMATGQREWLDLAKKCMQFAEDASDYYFGLLRAGKVGWAGAVLYTLTGEDKYKEIATHVGDCLIESQSKEGSWAMPYICPNDATAEMVVWLDEIHQALQRST